MGERPLECGQCKRPVKVIYKEVNRSELSCSEMCGECPVLQQRLHGDPTSDTNHVKEVCCGFCGTSAETVRVGGAVGCPHCYDVFSDIITHELIAAGGIPSALQKEISTQRGSLLHRGKTPDQKTPIAPSSRLTSLNEALNEALKRENYEQAAWLRDQIKSIKKDET